MDQGIKHIYYGLGKNKVRLGFFLCLLLFLFQGFTFKPINGGGGIEKGDKAPEITLKNLEGEEISLQTLEGKLVLVYFWASWCKPSCQKRILKFEKLFKKYQNASFKTADEGFKVYSISLDTKRKRWKKASKELEIPWKTNMSDLKGWDSKAVSQFGVGAIPRSFLVNGEGVVEAVNVSKGLSAILEKRKK